MQAFRLLIGAAWGFACLLPALAAEQAPGREIRADLIYHNYCSVCHGDRGDGRSRAQQSLVPPPRGFTDASARSQLTREYMIAVVRDGKPGTAMVGWKTQLNDREVGAVVDFIRSAFMQPKPGPGAPAVAGVSGTSAHGGRQRDAAATPGPAGAAARVDMSLPLPKGLAGNAARGARFYADNCATCHGAKGDGQGPRAYFINPRPRSFVDSKSGGALNRPALFAAIAMGRQGTEMPAWSKVLDDQQIADVAEYVFRRFIRAEAAARPRAASQ